MARKPSKKKRFEALEWDDLDAWAGGTIVGRGAAYQRSGAVADLVETDDGALLAWVQGGTRYATLVDISAQGILHSACTCPYRGECKHAVAVVLHYLEAIKAGRAIKKMGANDRRANLLSQADEDDFETFEDDWGEDDWGEDYWDEDDVGQDAGENITGDNEALTAYLKTFNKNQLIDLIKQLSIAYPQVREELSHRQTLQKSSVKQLLQAARAEIAALDDIDPSWDAYHRYEVAESADLSRLCEYLQALIDKKHADKVLDLGKALMEAGSRRVEIEPESESSYEIAGAMRLVFQALRKSTLAPVEQMMWAAEFAVSDDYSLLEDDAGFWSQDFSAGNWSEFADRLDTCLAAIPIAGGDNYSKNYRREQLVDRLITALGKAGRYDEIIPLCERDVTRTDRYERLVSQLLQAGLMDEAKAWISKGIEATHQRYPGIAAQLRKRYLELCEQTGDWLQVAAVCAEDFFNRCDYSTFQALQKAAEKAQVWPAVRQISLCFLQTGESHRGAKNPQWPLPDVLIPRVDRSRTQTRFPVKHTLIDIALAQNDIEKALYWYEYKAGQGAHWQIGRDDAVAAAIAKAYPDKAMAIWLRLANMNISQAKQSGYETGAKYLKKIRNLATELEQEEDWQTILTAVRSQHRRKRNMIAILDRMERRKILS